MEEQLTDRHQDVFISRDIPLATSTIYASPTHTSSSHQHGIPVFSPTLDGADNYSRYPDPRVVLNRRSMPVPPSNSPSTTYEQPSHALERSQSHGGRSHPLPPGRRPTVRSVAPHQPFNDRMPPRPAGFGQTPMLSRPMRSHSNRENDGSAEEEMMAREFEQMQLRGGADGQRRSDENAPTRVAAGMATMLDDTPPREGRFAMLMGS